MKKIYSIFFAALALSAASCQVETIESDETPVKEVMTITAGFNADTKTALAENGISTLWNRNDLVSVFDARTEDNNRKFSIVAEDDAEFPASTATFATEEDFQMPEYPLEQALIVALYPYQEEAFCNFMNPGDGENLIIGLNIPAEQIAVKDGFDPRAAFALATDKYTNKDNVRFKNLYSLLKVSVAEEGVKEIKVVISSLDKAVGKAQVVLNREVVDNVPVFNGGCLEVVDGSEEVTLKFEDEESTFEKGAEYGIAVAPACYTNIKVYLDDVLVKDVIPYTDAFLSANKFYTIKDLKKPASRSLSFPQETYSVLFGNKFTAPELSGETEGVVYTSSNEEVATVDAATGAVTIVAEGTTVITATAPKTATLLEGEASYTLVVGAKADRGLAFNPTSVEVAYGATSFELPALTGETEGVAYISSNTEVATVDAATGEVTITGVGETVITASADANETHLAGSAEYTLTVNKAERTLTFSASTFTATVGDSFTPPTLTGTPDPSEVKYTSSNTGVATVDENTGAVELVGAGETTITASIEATAEYLADEVTYTITVNSPDVWGICGTFNDWNTVNAASLTYVGDGWYEATDVAIYKDDEFKFVKDNSWDYSLGVNAVVEESKETELNEGNDNDIKVAKNGKFTVRLNPTTKVFTIVCTEENTEDVTVTFDVQRDWNQVNLHLWVDYEGNDNDITLTGDWPGVVLTKNASGKYEYSISAQYIGQRIGYILSNNGNNQTSDATFNLSHSVNELIIEALPDPGVTYDLYLDVTQCWRDGNNQRFAAYFYTDNVGSEWVDMQKISDTLYGVNIPDTKYKKVIFVRLNPSTTENNFNSGNKYNQTGDLTIPTDGKNLFSMTSWDGQTSGWSVKQ